MENFIQVNQYSDILQEQVKLFNDLRTKQAVHWIEDLIKPDDYKWGTAILIKNEDGKFLLGKRSEFCNEAETWGFPGGLIEHNQKSDDAAIRECLEETNLMPWEIKLVALEGTNISSINFIYEANSEKCSGILKRQASKVSELGWFSPEEIQRMDLFSYSQLTWETYVENTGIKIKKVNRIFCSGHRDITETEFSLHYGYLLDQALTLAEIGQKVIFTVGNYDGADIMIQKYIEKWITESGYSTDIIDNVTVNVCAVIDSETENTSRLFNILTGFYDWADADGWQTRNTDEDLTWIRKGKEDSGSAQNIQRRLDYNMSLGFNPTFTR